MRVDVLNQSQRTRRAIITNILMKAHNALPNNIVYLAGGYVRDYFWGINPKDIDLFVNDPRITLEQARVMADAIGREFRTQMFLMAEHDYEDGKWVFEGQGTADWEPIQLIVSRRFGNPVLGFDLNSSCAWAELNRFSGRTNVEKTRKFDEVMRTRVEKVYYPLINNRVVSHFNRVKDKLGLVKMVMDTDGFTRDHQRIINAMQAMLEGGLIEDPRQVFPAQAEGIDGNPVRLNDREEPMGEVRWVAHNEVEARANPIQGGAQVQPGLVNRGWVGYNFV